MEAKDVWEQLGLLREVSKTTGILHHAQVVHLQAWGQIALPHAKAIDIAWGADLRAIEYRAKVSEDKPPKDLKKRLTGLDESIKTLLGSDIKVTVKFGRQTIYTGAGKVKKNAPTSPTDRSGKAANTTHVTPNGSRTAGTKVLSKTKASRTGKRKKP